MEEIMRFSRVEYLVAFHAIITGFVATEFFVGGGEVMRQHHNWRNSYQYILFTILVFSMLLIFWWNIWERSTHVAASITNFMRILPYSIIFYMLTVVLFQGLRRNLVENLNDHFEKFRKTLFGLTGLYFIYDHIESVDNTDAIFRYAGFLFCVIGYFVKNRIVTVSLLLIGCATFSFYILWSYFNQFFFDNQTNAHYSKVEHLTIFLTFLFGFVVAEFLKGWSDMFYKKDMSNFSLTHFLWTLFSFFLLIDSWWGSWTQKALIAESLINFLFLLLSPFALYLLTVFFFPNTDHIKSDETIEYQDIFMRNKKYIFLSFAAFFLSNMLVSFIFDDFTEELRENIFRVIAVVFAIFAWKIHNHYFHKALIIISSILLIVNLIFSHSV